MSQGMAATGAIKAFSFVKKNANGTVSQCGSGDAPFGVSGPEAVAHGQTVLVHVDGDRGVPILLGTTTVRRGSYLKPDANGLAVVADHASEHVGARSREHGTTGQRILCDVTPFLSTDA